MTAKESNLPISWAQSTLGEICTPPQYGWTTKASSSGNLHLLRTTDITKGSVDWNSVPYCSEEPPDKRKYLLRDGDILISRAGSVGFSYLVREPKESVFASYLIRFRTPIDEKYLSYFLNSPSYWGFIQDKKLGIAVPNVNASKLKEIPVPVPPLPEQHRIVNKIEELFTQLDAGVELLQRTKVLLNQYRQSVLKAAFEGKLTEEWRGTSANQPSPSTELIKLCSSIRKQNGKLSRTEETALRSQDSLHDLPYCWVWCRLEDISVLITKGASPNWQGIQYTTDPSDILFVTSENVRNNWLDLTKPKYLEVKFNEIQKRSILRKGDLLLNIVGASIGRAAIYDLDTVANINQAVSLIRPCITGLGKYITYYLNSNQALRYYETEKVDVARANLSLKDVSEIPIPLPSLIESDEIVRQIELRFSIAESVENEISNCMTKSQNLRRAILSHAFQGKLVPQDPADEPASKLLERLKDQRSAEIPRGRKPRQTKMF